MLSVDYWPKEEISSHYASCYIYFRLCLNLIMQLYITGPFKHYLKVVNVIGILTMKRMNQHGLGL